MRVVHIVCTVHKLYPVLSVQDWDKIYIFEQLQSVHIVCDLYTALAGN
jgi:hypothetical protein